jgi:hypothetical protein
MTIYALILPDDTVLQAGDIVEIQTMGKDGAAVVTGKVVHRPKPTPAPPPDIGIAVSDGMGVSDRLR